VGSKTYLPINVYDAAIERMNIVFDRFEKVCVSFSGGKDSTVMLHIALKIAKERGRKLYALFVDLEGQYKVTIDHIEEMMVDNPNLMPYWVCLPINLRNAVSVFQPHWCCWDPDERENWVRDMPQHDCVVSDEDFFPFYWHRMEFEEFTPLFAHWLAGGESMASVVAIRSDESMNRYRTVKKKRKSQLVLDGKRHKWTTRITVDTNDATSQVYNVYPIYDWRVEDIWTHIGKHGLPYNKLYDYMYLSGMSIHEMRICQPYGDDQRKGLDQFHKIEPDTWFRILQRVSGANYGALYAGQKMLGYNRGLGLPPGHTWESYTRLLLDTMPPATREHYKEKFAVFLQWWEDHPDACEWWRDKGGYPTIPDEAPRKLESKKKAPSWRRLALCILRNDFWCKSISFSMTKNIGRFYDEVEETGTAEALIKPSVKEKYKDL